MPDSDSTLLYKFLFPGENMFAAPLGGASWGREEL